MRWIVDPLDGTINFLFRVPQWCVSIACEDERGTLAGVIYDPLREELFAATLDGPVTLNGEPVGAAPARPLPEALVVTGYAYDAAVRARQAQIVAEIVPRVRDVRRMGSAALDLAWLAAGRYDAYFEVGPRHFAQRHRRVQREIVDPCTVRGVRRLDAVDERTPLDRGAAAQPHRRAGGRTPTAAACRGRAPPGRPPASRAAAAGSRRARHRGHAVQAGLGAPRRHAKRERPLAWLDDLDLDASVPRVVRGDSDRTELGRRVY